MTDQKNGQEYLSFVLEKLQALLPRSQMKQRHTASRKLSYALTRI